MNEDASRYAGLGDYLKLLRNRWPLIVVPAVIAGVVALAVSLAIAPTYTATASIWIQDETLPLEVLGTPVYPGTAPGMNPVIVAQTSNTPATAAAVQRDLHTSVPASALSAATSVSGDATSSLVTVNASAGSGTFAAALANAFASEIAAGTNATVRQQFGSASAGLQARLNQLARRGPLTATQRANIESEISRLDFLHYNSAPAQVASTASVPGSPSSPKTLRNAGIGVVVGALLGLILAFLRESFDRRLRGSAAIEATLGYRLVGHVRADSLGRAVRPSRGADGRAAGDVEAFRIMRRNVERLAAGHDHRAIVVTSALPEEGKSSVAASLALSAAATGRRTLLIEADLRRPSLARMLGLSPAPGLSELLNGETDATAVIQTVPAQPSAPSRNGGAPSPNGSAGRLAAIASGRPSSRSAELLASARMPEFLADVKRSYDLVLLDAAPLLPVVDTLELLDIADAVVLCVQSGRTTREQAQAARAALGQFPPEAVGIAVTGLRPRDEPAGHGLYAYDYSGAERVEA